MFRDLASDMSNADAAHQTLTEAITSGVLGPGQSLREEELAEVFEVSRTPAREALMRLESERLVERRRRGLAVGHITARQILDVYALREALDGVAARLAAQHRTAGDVEELRQICVLMRDAMSVGDKLRMARLSIDFHDVTARASRNEMLQEFVASVHNWVKRLQASTYSEDAWARESLADHGVIVDALEAGDAEAAETAARAHMQHALQARIRALAQDRS
jgi:DNA-binding GntR family transcriptional regulator